jgi:predicted nuclease of predicted toxin-antitoxin system
VKFILDEGLPFRLLTFLEDEGHDVSVCGLDHPHALTDREILAIAHQERRILLTNDKDFGDLVYRDSLPHSGVILFRVGFIPIGDRLALLQQILIDYADQLDRFFVVTPRGIRVGSRREAGDRGG